MLPPIGGLPSVVGGIKQSPAVTDLTSKMLLADPVQGTKMVTSSTAAASDADSDGVSTGSLLTDTKSSQYDSNKEKSKKGWPKELNSSYIIPHRLLQCIINGCVAHLGELQLLLSGHEPFCACL